MRIELWGELVLEDLDGKVLYRKREKSRSFVRAWLHLLYAHMTSLSMVTPDIGGTNRSAFEYETSFQMNGNGGTSFGIVFGTGDTAVTVSDYGMEALIAAGEAAGQFQYCWNEVAERVVAGADCYFTVTRRAFNLSGGNITVAEWGLYARMWAGSNYYMCAVRDVPGAPLLVPTATVLTGVYTLKITNPVATPVATPTAVLVISSVLGAANASSCAIARLPPFSCSSHGGSYTA